jgi:hypothetical protein
VLITTSTEAGDIHPAEFVTVKVYVPAGRVDIVILVPVPEVVTLPGLRVIVHVPDAGSPFRTTLPVATEQVGCVILPGTGAVAIGEMITWVVAVVTPQPPEPDIVYVTI